ncbi:MAG: hypothetical protein HOP19_10240 [Acidobacteria bacterium]|nr:hypothetical protein [Acidobacteriota bacterium]
MKKAEPKASELKKQSPMEKAAAEILTQLGEQQPAMIYAERVRTQRTRSFALNATALDVQLQHTLLGVELKIGKKRLSCPDWATARYLAVFARVGVPEIAVPYDITQISRLADELESGWFRMQALAEHAGQGQTARWQSKLIKTLLNAQRIAIEAAGVGPKAPEFIQNTKQRRK